MRIVLALAVLSASASSIATAEEALKAGSKVPLLCTKSGEKVSGLTKICYYTCAKSEGALTATAYESCPRWAPRWRLNRNSQFGPSEHSK